jgi:uncharacterized protein YfaS (alpha-2-macroglobulin family)
MRFWSFAATERDTRTMIFEAREFLVEDNTKKLRPFTGILENIANTQTHEIIPHKKFTGLTFIPENQKPFYADIELQEVFPAEAVSPVSKGFFIQKEIFELTDTERKNPIKNLTVGKNYLVQIRVINNASHRQIAITDYIPTGTEFVNFAFTNTDQNLRQHVLEDACYGWCMPTFDHQEFHENFAQFFTDYLGSGAHEVAYIIQARIPGAYDVLPSKIEEMYFPEIFATTKGEKIRIE